MTDSLPADSPRPRVLLLGEAAARPDGLERALARAGFVIAEADDPRAAPTADPSPNVVLVTAREPDAALGDILEAVGYAFGPAMPRVVVLASEDRDGPLRALALGAEDAVGAPVHLPELCARLLLRRRSRPQGERRAPAPALDDSFQLVHDVCSSLRAEEILHQLVRRVARALDLARCSFVLTPQGQMRGRVAAEFDQEDARDIDLDLARYPEIVEARRTGQPVVVDDVHSDPLFAEVRRGWETTGPRSELRSVVALPVRVGGEVAGVFLLRPRDPRSRLTPAQVAFADSLARAAACALELPRRGDSAPATDLLTGCGTPDALDSRIREEFERARRYALSFSLILVDIDELRRFNDRLGPEGGDRLLAELAAVMRGGLRAPDYICRYGGDEFAIVLPETGLEGARHSVARVRERLSMHAFEGFGPDDERPRITAGIVTYPHPAAERTGDLFALVEAALLRAKGQTGERIGTAEYVATG